MIPSDSFLLDGDTALWVVPDEDHLPQHWERPCDRCGGTTRIACPGMSVEPKTQMGRDAAGLVMGKDYCYGMHMGHPCPDCIDGRHTFEIEAWLCDVYDCAKCIGGGHKRRDTFRVHVIDVLGIHDAMHPEYPGVIELTPERFVLIESVDASSHDITLPPDAAPGKWLVRLAVHTPENVDSP